MKLTLSILVLLLTVNTSIAQNKKQIKEDNKRATISFINNKKIKYSIVLMACDTCTPIKNIGYRVVVKLSKKQKEIVEKLDKSTWIKLLNSLNSDFASNLILYSLYNKDALILSRYQDIKEWRKYGKYEDLKFWREHLK